MDEHLKVFLWTMIAVLLLGGIYIGGDVISSHYESQAFNRIHGTDYTLGEWFWAEQTIKDYHIGTVENKNYEVDLNVNDNRAEGGNLI